MFSPVRVKGGKADAAKTERGQHPRPIGPAHAFVVEHDGTEFSGKALSGPYRTGQSIAEIHPSARQDGQDAGGTGDPDQVRTVASSRGGRKIPMRCLDFHSYTLAVSWFEINNQAPSLSKVVGMTSRAC
jgi:hypothetical protein